MPERSDEHAPIATELASWAGRLSSQGAGAQVASSALAHLLDALGNAVAARRLHAGEAGVRVARELGGPEQSHLVGDKGAVSAPAAAFGNGVLMHVLDFDDTHARALVHPTVVVAPAALAVAEEVGASGAETVAALAAGLEVACRLGAAVPHRFHARGLHATGVVGPVAAATAAGMLYRLSPRVLAAALGIAASSSAGLLEFLDTGANTKVVHPGSAGLNGVMAARLARAGIAGPESVFEGRRGLYRVLADADVAAEDVLGGLGQRWECELIGIKPYPSCQLMHAALDAAADVAASGRWAPSEIAAVTVYAHRDSVDIVCGPGAGSRAPRSVYDAKFDLPWSVAAMLHDGTVSIDTYSADSIVRPEVAATAATVSVHATDEPVAAADAPARVEVVLRDGTTLARGVQCSRGTTGRPMDAEAVERKFMINTAHAPGSGQLAALVWGLESAERVDPVLRGAAELLDSLQSADDPGGW